MSLGKIWIHLFYHHLWVDSRTNYILWPWLDNQSRRKKTLNLSWARCILLAYWTNTPTQILSQIHTDTHIHEWIGWMYIYIYIYICIRVSEHVYLVLSVHHAHIFLWEKTLLFLWKIFCMNASCICDCLSLRMRIYVSTHAINYGRQEIAKILWSYRKELNFRFRL